MLKQLQFRTSLPQGKEKTPVSGVPSFLTFLQRLAGPLDRFPVPLLLFVELPEEVLQDEADGRQVEDSAEPEGEGLDLEEERIDDELAEREGLARDDARQADQVEEVVVGRGIVAKLRPEGRGAALVDGWYTREGESPYSRPRTQGKSRIRMTTARIVMTVR